MCIACSKKSMTAGQRLSVGLLITALRNAPKPWKFEGKMVLKKYKKK